MVGQLQPVEGNVSRRSGLSIGRYHQHSAEVLDLAKSPVDYLKVGVGVSYFFYDKVTCVMGGGQPRMVDWWCFCSLFFFRDEVIRA